MMNFVTEYRQELIKNVKNKETYENLFNLTKSDLTEQSAIDVKKESESKGDGLLRRLKGGIFSNSAQPCILKLHQNDVITYWKGKTCKGTVVDFKFNDDKSILSV